jgi:hypothetical protein
LEFLLLPAQPNLNVPALLSNGIILPIVSIELEAAGCSSLFLDNAQGVAIYWLTWLKTMDTGGSLL